jgi:phosphate starvation-inducible PhoH-like protein
MPHMSEHPDDRAPILEGELLPSGDALLPYRMTLSFPAGQALREVVGELGAHLKVLGRALGVKAGQRGDQVTITGQDGSIRLAAYVLRQLHEVAADGIPLVPADVDQACRLVRHDPGVHLIDLYRDTINVGTGKKRLSPRSQTQRRYVQAIREQELVFGVGPAGTGKTYLAMAMALAALMHGDVHRIILCRPAVEAGEKLGFLPGDLAEKVNPYLRPLYDALNDLAGFDKAERMMAKGVIEVAPLAFMRGRTLSNAFVILDEAQNTTPEQMKMLLTRIGIGSRVVVTGDLTQIDLPGGARCGLLHALEVLAGVDDVGVVHFTEVDVVRHPLVSTIIRAYARADADAPEPSRSPGPRRPRNQRPPGEPLPEEDEPTHA